MKSNKFKSESTLNIHKTNNGHCTKKETRFCPNDSITLLSSKLDQIKELLNNMKEEMIEMRYSLKNLKRDFAVSSYHYSELVTNNLFNLFQHDEEHVKHIIEQTICFTRGVYDSKYLDNIILLLNEDIMKASLENWPFWSETSITYSDIERNYIV